ncbi:MFS transporter [Xylariaceae sp. FL1272]|nr:MFS transporter [Xylariaceae sp. FL1272]
MTVLADPAVSNDDLSPQAKPYVGTMPWIRSFVHPQHLDDGVQSQPYPGNGTDADPYIIDYLLDDHEDAMNFSKARKWAISLLQSLFTFALTFASSVYANGIGGVIRDFAVCEEVATLGLSLFVLGFALGPLIWAPLSEMYGRKYVFLVSSTAYVALSVGAAYAPDITTLLVLRFFASAFGSSSMTNTGGIIADMFSKAERGLATALFITAPFLGPAFGPIVGGYLNESSGWRWILRLIFILGGSVWIAAVLAIRETYAPCILRRRAKALSRSTGLVHVSRLDAGQSIKTLSQELSVSFVRPWLLLLREPIVLLSSLYVSVIYGTLYMFFAGFPLIFQAARGWSQGNAGLPFIGVAIGVLLATLAAGVDNKRYVRLCAAAEANGRVIEPEARLSTAMAGSIVLPVGLFLFAWTTYPWVHWIAPVIGATLFSCGLVMVFISLLSYLVDTYVVYAASVLAANAVLRSLFGTAFPLFTTQIYESLGNQWASSIPAFLVLACVPFPFLFYKYGLKIRSKGKYASEAAKILEVMRRRHVVVIEGEPRAFGKETA